MEQKMRDFFTAYIVPAWWLWCLVCCVAIGYVHGVALPKAEAKNKRLGIKSGERLDAPFFWGIAVLLIFALAAFTTIARFLG